MRAPRWEILVGLLPGDVEADDACMRHVVVGGVHSCERVHTASVCTCETSRTLPHQVQMITKPALDCSSVIMASHHARTNGTELEMLSTCMLQHR